MRWPTSVSIVVLLSVSAMTPVPLRAQSETGEIRITSPPDGTARSPGVTTNDVPDTPRPQARSILDSEVILPAVWPHGKDFDAGPDPEVIVRAPADIRRLWEDVQLKLSRARDPSLERVGLLIQRGHLLLAVHSRARAYRDLQDAAQVLVAISSSDVDVPSAYSKLLVQHRYPEPLPSPSIRDLDGPYCVGYHAFWEGNYEQAMVYFDQAIEKAPYEPSSYYYRALACRKLGRVEEAGEFARLGTFWEFQAIRSHWPNVLKKQTWYVDRQLTRVQGGWRLWLEGYRETKRTLSATLLGTLPDEQIGELASPIRF